MIFKIVTKNVGTVRSQIAARLADLKTSALKIFGLDEFGNVAKNLKDIPDKPIIGRVTFQINRLIKPLKDIVEGVSEFATGRGAKLFGFIRNFIGGGVKVVSATIGRRNSYAENKRFFSLHCLMVCKHIETQMQMDSLQNLVMVWVVF